MILNYLILCPLLIFSTNSIAQINLTGSWNMSCALEKTNDSHMKFCPLCTINISPDKSSADISGCVFNFTSDSLYIVRNGEETHVKYELDSTVNSLSFSFNKVPYKFKFLLLTTETTQYILRESNGSLLLLSKE